MGKTTRRWKFESQIDNFKQLKSEADSDIKKVESLSLTADYGIKWDIDSIVKKIVEVLNINQKKLRDDPEYQEAMKYRSKLIVAKKITKLQAKYIMKNMNEILTLKSKK